MHESENLADTGQTKNPQDSLPQDANYFLRIGQWLLITATGGFLVWAAWAPLDAGVPAPGVTIVESYRKTVAHLTGGIVTNIYVRDMQAVKEGQALITLDTSATLAQYQAAIKEYLAVLAAWSRLDAERRHASAISFPKELTEANNSLDSSKQIEAQRALFKARRHALESDIHVLAAAAQTYEQEAKSKSGQLNVLQIQLSGLRELASEGYVARNTQLELERQAIELEGSIALALNQSRDARLRLQQRKEEFQKDVETDLTLAQGKLSVLKEQVDNFYAEWTRTTIRSPVDGFVNALAVHTIGGVVRGGDSIMEIIPTDERLIFEVKIASHLIDLVHVDLPVDIQLENFHDQPNLIIEGRILSVSADLVPDRNPQQPPYYVARVELTGNGRTTLGNRRLQPGMIVSALIKTGERSLLSYLIQPLRRRMHEALKEV